MKLNYGVVVKYNEKGFGFIKLLSFKNINCDEVFFHISKVKKTGIEPKLVELEKDNTKVINLWFTTEETEKGTALNECWLNSAEIPNEYLVDFVESIGIHLTSMEKEKSFEQFFDIFSRSITQTKKIAINKPPSKTKAVESTTNDKQVSLKRKYNLSSSELEQIEEYVHIYKSNSFKEHYEVNNYISKHKLWGGFSDLRSLNDHGSHKRIPGILPKFYSVVCQILAITGADGAPLENAERY